MAPVCSGWGEFSQFVSNHVFGHEDGNEFISVMDRQIQSHKFRHNHGTSGPGADDPPVVCFLGPVYIDHQMIIHDWPFFQ